MAAVTAANSIEIANVFGGLLLAGGEVCAFRAQAIVAFAADVGHAAGSRPRKPLRGGA